MAKYDWKQLEKDYILSDCKSVSQFIKNKEIPYNGTTKTRTKGWSEKKKLIQDRKATKTIEKVIEKEAEAEASKIADIKTIANDLALIIKTSMTELNRHIAKSKTKTKRIKYDHDIAKPTEEIIEETEKIQDYISVIDRQGLKQLTSALKDINDIVLNKNDEDTTQETIEKVTNVLVSIKKVAQEQKNED